METTYGFKLFMSNASGTGLTNVRRKRLFQEIKMSSKMEPHINTSNMTIQEVAVDAVTPYENNPRKIPQEAIDKVAASIKEFGFKQPIVVDKDMVIIVGHTRLLAAKKLGYETVPVLVASDLSPEKARAYRLADNKTNEFTDWDFETLQEELASFLSIEDFNMEDFGFDMSFLDKNADDVQDDDFDPDTAYNEAKNNCHVTLGDVWELGQHRLMCGDSTILEDVKKLMGDEKADLCVTDPPYNVNYEGSNGMKIQNDKMESSMFNRFLCYAFSSMEYCLNPGAPFYVWFASREHINFEQALNEAGLSVRQELVWVKNSLVIGRQDYQWRFEPCLYGWKEGTAHRWYGGRDKSNVLEYDKPQRSDMHPTMKPLPLFAHLVQNSSKKNDVVLDLFGGSGTTLITCEEMERQCRMMEYDPIYCQVIINRWEALTGKTAKKIC